MCIEREIQPEGLYFCSLNVPVFQAYEERKHYKERLYKENAAVAGG